MVLAPFAVAVFLKCEPYGDIPELGALVAVRAVVVVAVMLAAPAFKVLRVGVRGDRRESVARLSHHSVPAGLVMTTKSSTSTEALVHVTVNRA